MKNAEKYAGDIATLIANQNIGACEVFADLELLRCSYCPLRGICSSQDKLEKWLLQEAPS